MAEENQKTSFALHHVVNDTTPPLGGEKKTQIQGELWEGLKEPSTKFRGEEHKHPLKSATTGSQTQPHLGVVLPASTVAAKLGRLMDKGASLM